jgi:hypothetical protein
MIKKGCLVNFSYGRVGASISGIGLIVDSINEDMYKLLYKGKEYWVHEQFINPIKDSERSI